MATTVMSSGGTDEAVPVLRQPASQPAARVLTRAYTPTGLWGKGREGKGRKRERAVRFMAAAAAAAVLLNRAVCVLLALRETMYPGRQAHP